MGPLARDFADGLPAIFQQARQNVWLFARRFIVAHERMAGTCGTDENVSLDNFHQIPLRYNDLSKPSARLDDGLLFLSLALKHDLRGLIGFDFGGGAVNVVHRAGPSAVYT